MEVERMKIGATNLAAQKMPDYPTRETDGCPDYGRDTYTPSRNSGGPDDTSDPDFGGSRDSGGFSGPDGYTSYDEFH
ncbi:hypothetical protein [Methanocorpusculum sp. GPch4]|jgi:hypothetical protein|uniref:hypothetical protein n=1 Tax=Methanocorpusculum sp. GPch4 TaxID=2527877 RepID=UPI001ADE898C|nr:hypothetical protein [Methanocorpusculum sp. GPch4]